MKAARSDARAIARAPSSPIPSPTISRARSRLDRGDWLARPAVASLYLSSRRRLLERRRLASRRLSPSGVRVLPCDTRTCPPVPVCAFDSSGPRGGISARSVWWICLLPAGVVDTGSESFSLVIDRRASLPEYHSAEEESRAGGPGKSDRDRFACGPCPEEPPTMVSRQRLADRSQRVRKSSYW